MKPINEAAVTFLGPWRLTIWAKNSAPMTAHRAATVSRFSSVPRFQPKLSTK